MVGGLLLDQQRRESLEGAEAGKIRLRFGVLCMGAGPPMEAESGHRTSSVLDNRAGKWQSLTLSTRERYRRAIAKRSHQPAHVACPRSSRSILPLDRAADRNIFQPADEESAGGGLSPCHAVGEKGSAAFGRHDPGVESLLIVSSTELPFPAKDEAIRTILPRPTAFLYSPYL